MLQFPSTQTLLIVLQGEEGCGKSVILDFLSYIMGRHMTIEIQDVKENLFGRFNAHLSGKVLLNINETDRKEMMPFIEKLKTMITSPTITIEEKGQKKKVEDNHFHLCMTINPENVLPIKEGSRRFFYSRASSLYIGNTEYFNELFAFIEKPKNQRAFYQFLMKRPVKQKITIKDIPASEVMNEMYELNRDPVEDFAMEFTGEHSALDNYTTYRQYLQQNGLKFEISRKCFESKFVKYMDKYNIKSNRKTVDGVKSTFYSKVDEPTPPVLIP
jgi:phage/plasmid-associated DNA primase